MLIFKQKTFSGGPEKAHSKNLELVKGLGGLSSETYFMERSKQNILYSNSHYSLFEVAKLNLEHFRKIAAIDTYIKDVSYILPICVSQFFPCFPCFLASILTWLVNHRILIQWLQENPSKQIFAQSQ